MSRHLARIFCIGMLAVSLVAQQPKNQKKGFNANDVYQMNGIDTINAFNGNLVLTIPVGLSYPLGGGSSYQLALISNANVWEAEEICRPNPESTAEEPPCITVCPFNKMCEDHERVLPTIMHPHRRANAGLGWQLTLGRLYEPEHPAMRETSIWTYESPDGADHPFDSGDTATVSYTTDGSYLRMRVDTPSAGLRTIDFPNGDWQIFGIEGVHWELKQMGNQFPANVLTFTWAPTIQSYEGHFYERWIITDSHAREQWVDFETVPYDGEYRRFVGNIWLTQFGSSEKARYKFYYEVRNINRGPHHTDDAVTPQTASVRVLTSVVPPDNTEFWWDYAGGSAADSSGGLPIAMGLPTGGLISWSWGTYVKPSTSAATGEQYLAESTGVFTRSLWGRTDPATSLRPLIGTSQYHPGVSCEDQYQDVEDQCTLHTFFVNKITDPSGTMTESYFSVAPTVGIWSDLEYGQPIARHLPDGTGTRFLSTRTLRPPGIGESGPVAMRSTYLQMEHTAGKYFRSKSSRIVHEDDVLSGSPVYMDTDSSDWDGYGHYRQVQTSGNVPQTRSRIVRTEYLAPPAGRWITGLYTEKSIRQDSQKTATRYCYDDEGTTATWALTRIRTLANVSQGTTSPSLSTKDIVSDFTYDAAGNVVEELQRGGDITPVGVQGCGSLVGDVTYHVVNTYSHGSLATSKYLRPDGSFAFLSADNDIDLYTGLVKRSRDSATVRTDFEYDNMGRITLVMPQGRAVTEYKYPPNAPETYQIVAETTVSTGGSSTYKKYDFDALGRITREWTSLPDAQQNRQETQYDALGRKLAETEPGSAPSLPTTYYTYDSLGKPLTVTRPDGSQVKFKYFGERVRERTQRLATPFDPDKEFKTIEYYDGYGQLVQVDEPSGPTTSAAPTGASVQTAYTYAPSGALKTVLMTSGAQTQRRSFDYDGRGFLVWESHPENGVVNYTYDSRGNVKSKTFGAGSPQDLQFEYDEAGRVDHVEARVDGGFASLKAFNYGSGNSGANLKRGKLTWAVRFNYDKSQPGYVYRIEDIYAYNDVAGRLTSRTTNIWREETLLKTLSIAVSLDERDLPVTITYPTCNNCGMPAADANRSGIIRSYDRGRLTSMGNPLEPKAIISSVSFWPNGMQNVLTHGNGISDTQDVTTMMRPSRLRFGQYDRCIAPTISDAGQPTNQSGTPAILTVSATGTGPIHYEWFNETDGTVVSGDLTTVSVTPSATSKYHVTVVGACGVVRSNTVEVAVTGCPVPSISSIRSDRQVDGSYILSADVAAKAGRRYSWKILPALYEVGTDPELTVNPSSTVQYRLTVEDDCGPTSRDVQIAVRAAFESSASVMSAQVLAGNGIEVTWPAVANATTYVLERRSGVDWLEIANQSTLTYVDHDVQTNKTYAYRVYALATGGNTASNYMSSVVATTRVFAAAVPNGAITTTPSNEMLAAVNSVRAAAGWPALTWGNILAPSQPLPAPGSVVLGTHVAACRARMNEALQALGAFAILYSPSTLEGQSIAAAHINEVQQRANGGVL